MHFFFAILLPAQALAAQGTYKVTGRVMDAQKSGGIGYATVTAVSTDSTKARSTWVCNADGRFEYALKDPGTYVIGASAVGYSHSADTVVVDRPSTAMGDIVLRPQQDIEEVVVQVSRPLVTMDVDKLTYSVDADPEAPASTLLDMLRKTPMLTVDAEDNVQLKGQGNYKVLVNGKSSSLMDKSFKEVVRSMPAGSVKSIEVITNPPAKYEAEGVGGIINIITDRKSGIGGYNGGVGVRADSRGGYGGNAYVTAKQGKFSISANGYGGTYRGKWGYGDTYKESPLQDDNRYMHTLGRNKGNGKYFGGNIEAGYEIDTFNLVTVSLWGNGGSNENVMLGMNVVRDVHDVERVRYSGNIANESNYGGLSGSVNYQRTFRKPDKTFTLSYKLDNNTNRNNSTSWIDGLINYPTFGTLSRNKGRGHEHTFQVDYADPLSDKHSIETGTKIIIRRSTTDPESFTSPSRNDPWVYDPQQVSTLDYDQYILQLYASYAFKYKRFKLKAGARLETAWNDAVFKSAGSSMPFDNNLFNVVPTIHMGYTTKKKKQLTLAYSQRLSRPGLWYLNPYVNLADPMNISFGNPYLDTEVSHSFNASYGSFGPKLSLNISASAMLQNNSIEQVMGVYPNFAPPATPVDTPDGATITTYQNAGRNRRYGTHAYVRWQITKRLSISSNLDGGYVSIMDDKKEGNEGFVWSANLSVEAPLWKAATLFGGGYCSSPHISMQSKGSRFLFYNFGVRQTLFDKKVIVNLAAQNPFAKYMTRTSTVETPTLYQRMENKFYIRRFHFGVTYNFGKTQVQVQRIKRGIQNDDVKSGGGSTGGGE